MENVKAIKDAKDHVNSSLFIVSNRLPITIKDHATKGIQIKFSSGGLVSGLQQIHEQNTITWIGHGGIFSRKKAPDIEAELAKRRLVAVPLEKEFYQMYYNGMSNETIWPLFHYFPANIRFSYEDWKAYELINHQFAEKILSLVNDNDRVWVHDYHLMLLPKLLSQEKRNLQIAYFHHIPFPSSDIFRVLPARKDILEGILGANLIGFHSFDYVRHFLSSVSRVLGYDIHVDEVYLDTHIAKVGVFPLGVDFLNISRHLEKIKISKQHSKVASAIGTPYIFLGVDRLDYTKGIPERMAAFRRFLEEHPEYIGKVTLVQLCVPTRSDIKIYNDLKSNVERLVSEINGELGTPAYTPIHYLYKNLPIEEVVALYKASHVALVTPLRDGLNLVAKEYVASRDDNEGVLILSEFAGSSVEMGEALWVNPYDIKDMAAKMHLAVTMPQKERQRRMSILRERVQRNDNMAWSRSFLEAWQKSVSLSQLQTTFLKGHRRFEVIGEIVKGNRIFIFCDNDGTLTPIKSTPEQAIPDSEVIELVRSFTKLPFIYFTLVTGRPKNYCDMYFRDLPINIFAEHGSFFKSSNHQNWKSFINSDDFSQLKEELLIVFKMFVNSVPGSHIEEKANSLVWHYRQSEPHFADNQAKALIASLQQLLQNTPYMPHGGKKLVEVRNRQANKGQAIEYILEKYSWQKGDIIITVGDDTTDEDMYKIHSEVNISIHVGRPHFKAKYCLNSPYDLKLYLQELLTECQKRKRQFI